MAASNAPAAQNIQRAVSEMVGEGRTDGEIRALIVNRFGERVSLVPASDGLVGLVWVLPIVVAVLAIAALVAVLWRWRRAVGSDGAASAADRALVEEFLAEREALTDTRVTGSRVTDTPFTDTRLTDTGSAGHETRS